MRSTLAHELTHVLQDQHFGLNREFDTDGEASVFRALVEGDANRIEAVYADKLSESDHDQLVAAQRADRGAADLGKVPPALVQLFGAPYALGGPLVDFIFNARAWPASMRRCADRRRARRCCSTRSHFCAANR